MYLRDLQDEDFEVAIKVKILSYFPNLPHDTLAFSPRVKAYTNTKIFIGCQKSRYPHLECKIV